MKRISLTGWLCLGVIMGAVAAVFGWPYFGGTVFAFCVLWLIVHTAGMAPIEENEDEGGDDL